MKNPEFDREKFEFEEKNLYFKNYQLQHSEISLDVFLENDSKWFSDISKNALMRLL